MYKLQDIHYNRVKKNSTKKSQNVRFVKLALEIHV